MAPSSVSSRSLPIRERRLRPSERSETERRLVGPATAAATLFSAAGHRGPALHREAKERRLRRPPPLAPAAVTGGAVPAGPRFSVAREGRERRGPRRTGDDPMTAETIERHASSATAAVLEELQLYGYRPFADEPDSRPLLFVSTSTKNSIDICTFCSRDTYTLKSSTKV